MDSLQVDIYYQHQFLHYTSSKQHQTKEQKRVLISNKPEIMFRDDNLYQTNRILSTELVIYFGQT